MGRISIGETPNSGITESKTMHIKMLTVPLKTGFGNILNQCEDLKVERGHGQSQVPWAQEDFRSGEGLDKLISRGSKRYSGKKGTYFIIRTGMTSLSEMNKHLNYLSRILSLPKATQRAGNSNQRNYLAFFRGPSLSPLLCAKSNHSSLSPFKNIINILSGVGCAHYLQMDASCLVSSHAGFGIICQAMLLVPFFFN